MDTRLQAALAAEQARRGCAGPAARICVLSVTHDCQCLPAAWRVVKGTKP